MTTNAERDVTVAKRGRGAIPKDADVVITASGVTSKAKDAVSTGGEIARFSGKVVRSLPDTRHYVSEVFHQAGVLIVSSGLIIWLMLFVMGSVCGLEASYTLKAIDRKSVV